MCLHVHVFSRRSGPRDPRVLYVQTACCRDVYSAPLCYLTQHRRYCWDYPAWHGRPSLINWPFRHTKYSVLLLRFMLSLVVHYLLWRTTVTLWNLMKMSMHYKQNNKLETANKWFRNFYQKNIFALQPAGLKVILVKVWQQFTSSSHRCPSRCTNLQVPCLGFNMMSLLVSDSTMVILCYFLWK